MSEESNQAPRVPADTVAAFDDAQRRAIRLVRRVVDQLQAGMTEADVVQAATAGATEFGFNGWFHTPEVRFNGLAAARNLTRGKLKLKRGDIVEIDLAPSDDQAFGDVGVAFGFETKEEPTLVHEAREICRAAIGYASRWKCTGEVYVFADAWANNRRMSLGDNRSIGHVCLPRQGWVDTGWPKLARAAIYLRRNQVEWFNHRRMHGFYAINPRVVKGKFGCAFEEMVLIDGDVKRVMGRDSIDEIGTF